MSRPPRHLADLELAERRKAVADLGERPFRADQLSRHYFGRYTDAAQDMTDIPVALREALASELLPRLLAEERTLSADRGATRKTVWRAPGRGAVESVLMKYTDRVTMCVSSQGQVAGWPARSARPGKAGLTRNLSTAEIVSQVVAGERLLAPRRRPGLQHRVHGHGRATRQLQERRRGRPPDDRPGAGRTGDLAALGDRLHRRAGAGDRQAGGRGPVGDAGPLPARAR